jgi:hypothetical protein
MQPNQEKQYADAAHLLKEFLAADRWGIAELTVNVTIIYQ